MSLFEQLKALVTLNGFLLRSAQIEDQYAVALSEHLAGRYQEAFSLVEPLAEAGYLPAQNLLGTMYLLGQGIQESGTDACHWLCKAYDNGYQEAASILGMALVTGKAGIPINMERGTALLAEAVVHGDAEAQQMLDLIQAKKGIFAKMRKQ